MGFIHNIDPVLLSVGPLEIRYYGVVYVLGFVLLYFWFRHLIKTKEIRLTQEELYDFIFYIMVGVLVGSRLVHAIFWEPMYFLTQPWKLVFLWEGGMAFHGGIIGVAVATWLFWRKPEIRKKISFNKLGDNLAIPAMLMFAIGRIANFINAELPGTISNVKWCVVYPKYDSACRHPQVLYSALARFAILGRMLFINTKKNLKDGFIYWNMLLLAGVSRFFIDFYRVDDRMLGLTAGQYLSIVMFAVSAIVLFKFYRKEFKKIF